MVNVECFQTVLVGYDTDTQLVASVLQVLYVLYCNVVGTVVGRKEICVVK